MRSIMNTARSYNALQIVSTKSKVQTHCFNLCGTFFRNPDNMPSGSCILLFLVVQSFLRDSIRRQRKAAESGFSFRNKSTKPGRKWTTRKGLNENAKCQKIIDQKVLVKSCFLCPSHRPAPSRTKAIRSTRSRKRLQWRALDASNSILHSKLSPTAVSPFHFSRVRHIFRYGYSVFLFLQ